MKEAHPQTATSQMFECNFDLPLFSKHWFSNPVVASSLTELLLLCLWKDLRSRVASQARLLRLLLGFLSICREARARVGPVLGISRRSCPEWSRCCLSAVPRCLSGFAVWTDDKETVQQLNRGNHGYVWRTWRTEDYVFSRCFQRLWDLKEDREGTWHLRLEEVD